MRTHVRLFGTLDSGSKQTTTPGPAQRSEVAVGEGITPALGRG